MNRNRPITLCLIAAAALGFAFLGFGVRHLQAQQQQAQPTAVAVVNVPELISRSNAFQAFQADLNQQRQTTQAQLQQREGAINTMIQDLELIPLANAQQRADKEREIVAARVEAQAWYQIQLQDQAQQQRMFLIALYGRIDETVSQVAQRQGYDLVLFDTPSPDFAQLNVEQLLQVIGERRVVYRDSDIDLTESVLAQLNLNDQVPGGE